MARTDYNIAGIPDLTVDQLARILRDAQSPATPEAVHIHAALKATGVRPSVWLAFFRQESRFGLVGVVRDFATHNAGNVRTPEDPALAMGIIDTPRGKFAKYANWADGAFDWGKRLRGPKYAGRGLLTVRQVLPVYAPTGDQENNPTAYINAVLASISEWVGETTMGHVPQPPWTDHPITKQIGIGRDPDAQRAPQFVVLHSMGGTLKGTDGYFPRPEVAALTDFGIGQVDAGGGFAQIIRWNDPHGKQIGWASGPVKVPEGDGPRILALFGGAAGLNRYGVSIEHDDTTTWGGVTGTPGSQPVSAAQWSASCWLQAFIHAEWLHQTAATFDYNAWHREFCGAGYKTCPNPRITDHVGEYQAAVKAIMARYQEGTPYPVGGLVINGLKIATPPAGDVVVPIEGGDVQEPKAGTAGQYLNAKGELIAVVNFGGTATEILGVNYADIGGSVRNAKQDVWDRSLVKGAMKPWVKRP